MRLFHVWQAFVEEAANKRRAAGLFLIQEDAQKACKRLWQQDPRDDQSLPRVEPRKRLALEVEPNSNLVLLIEHETSERVYDSLQQADLAALVARLSPYERELLGLTTPAA